MRSLLLLPALCASVACASDPLGPPPDDAPRSVRAVLEAGGAARGIAHDPSAGTITARQWRGPWEEGVLSIEVDGGALALSADRDGALVLDELHVALAPIALPDAVFGQPARLTELALELGVDDLGRARRRSRHAGDDPAADLVARHPGPDHAAGAGDAAGPADRARGRRRPGARDRGARAARRRPGLDLGGAGRAARSRAGPRRRPGLVVRAGGGRVAVACSPQPGLAAGVIPSPCAA